METVNYILSFTDMKKSRRKTWFFLWKKYTLNYVEHTAINGNQTSRNKSKKNKRKWNIIEENRCNFREEQSSEHAFFSVPIISGEIYSYSREYDDDGLY